MQASKAKPFALSVTPHTVAVTIEVMAEGKSSIGTKVVTLPCPPFNGMAIRNLDCDEAAELEDVEYDLETGTWHAQIPGVSTSYGEERYGQSLASIKEDFGPDWSWNDWLPPAALQPPRILPATPPPPTQSEMAELIDVATDDFAHDLMLIVGDDEEF